MRGVRCTACTACDHLRSNPARAERLHTQGALASEATDAPPAPIGLSRYIDAASRASAAMLRADAECRGKMGVQKKPAASSRLRSRLLARHRAQAMPAPVSAAARKAWVAAGLASGFSRGRDRTRAPAFS